MDGLERDREALSWFTRAWDDYFNFLPLVLAAALAQALLAAGSFLLVKTYGSFLPALPYLLLAATPVSVGLNLYYVKLARGGGAGLADLFSAFPVYHRALGVSVLLGAATAAGLLLFILPGAVFYTAFAFSEYAVVDRRLPVRDCFRFSGEITAGWKTRLFPLFLAAALVSGLAPDIYLITGPFSKPSASLDLRPWTVTAAALKTLVFIPWLNLAAARAYAFLSAPRPPENEVADA